MLTQLAEYVISLLLYAVQKHLADEVIGRIGSIICTERNVALYGRSTPCGDALCQRTGTCPDFPSGPGWEAVLQ